MRRPKTLSRNSKIQEWVVQDGLLGLVEAFLLWAKKVLWTAYYRFRFRKFGQGSVVTGPLSLRGAKRIDIGNHVVIEGGASFRASGNGSITIGHFSYIEKGARLFSQGDLALGEKVYVLEGAQIASGERVQLSDRVWVARGSTIEGNNIVLESDVILGPGVFVIDADHQIDREGLIKMNSGQRAAVRIKTNAWVGAKAVVLKGVTIGEGSIVGAGSVVTKEIPPHSVAVGVPAKVKSSSLPVS